MKTILTLILSFSLFLANGNVPGKKQSKPILLKGGTVYTITNGILENTDLLFEKGKITQIGKNITLPKDCEIIDISGKHVYPGLIEASSTLGLVEIGAVRSTNDNTEVGRFTPEVSSQTAYNADSEIIPTIRANGITHSLAVPQGGSISGMSSLMQLDAWNSEDAVSKENLAMHLNWPNMTVFSGGKPAAKQQEAIDKNVAAIRDFFDKAIAYKKAGKSIRKNVRLEAMKPFLSGDKKVIIRANSFEQIRAAISFADSYKLDIILLGARDALLAKELILEHKIPVILSTTQRLPKSTDSAYDRPFAMPAALAKAGIHFSISNEGQWQYFNANLPFLAGQAVAFGLSHEDALKSVTINTAKAFGLEKQLGSLEVGKEASLIISEGDILDMLTNKVVYEFIEGRKVDLNNRHRILYNKYKQKGE